MNRLVLGFHGGVHVSGGHFLCKKGVGGVCGVGMGNLRWAGFFPGGCWWNLGVRVQEARAQLKIGGATPGGSGGHGVSPVFRFGAANPIHFDGIGVATPKNSCDRILGVATYH